MTTQSTADPAAAHAAVAGLLLVAVAWLVAPDAAAAVVDWWAGFLRAVWGTVRGAVGEVLSA